MSEPLTTAKVVLTTTKGNLEIELWAKEIPKTSKNFIQNCIDKKYVGQTFNRISKDFLIQSDSEAAAYNEDGKLERFPRLKFNRRGLLGASSGSNADSFFITFKETPELNHSHTIFGKIVADTHYTVVSIHDGELKEGLDAPVYPVEIIDCEVVIPYFSDLNEKKVEYVIESQKPKKEKKKSKIRISLNLEDDEEDAYPIGKKITTKVETLQKDQIAQVNETEVTEKKEVTEVHENETTEVAEEVEEVEVEEEGAEEEEEEEEVDDRPKIERDLEIDSDYDPYLDLSDEEKVDPKLIYTHTFKI